MQKAAQTFADEVAAFQAAHADLEVLEVLSTDINGIFRGKQYPPETLDKLATKPIQFPLSTLLHDATGAIPGDVLVDTHFGDPDCYFHAVPGTLVDVPWADRRTVQVQLQARERDGTPVFCDPRNVLQSVIDAFAEQGLRPIIAIELEFILVGLDENARPFPTGPSEPFPFLPGPQCLTMETLADYAPLIERISAYCAAQDVPVTSILSEYGDGQLEANLTHGDAIEASDQAMKLKRIVKRVARENGWLASFMAKPFAGATGNGLHVHVSILDENGQNIFALSDGEEKLANAVAGTLQTMPAAMGIFAPNANSYRRLEPGFFVPTHATWGENHRAVAVRLPLADGADRRLEHRVAGADACPYLAVAAVLAGVIEGLNGGLSPPAPVAERGTLPRDASSLPRRWTLALDALDASEALRRRLGEDFVNLYLKTKRCEEERFHLEITDRDYAWYVRVV